MYAEGIDYQGDMLAGVLVVGPALPSVNFEQELLKRYFDEKYGSGFEYAYLIPGMTRVVQSAGRVIRSESDIGIIALMCKRFTLPQYTKFFPSHWYESSPRELVVKKPADEVRRFFESHREARLPIRQTLLMSRKHQTGISSRLDVCTPGIFRALDRSLTLRMTPPTLQKYAIPNERSEEGSAALVRRRFQVLPKIPHF